ncbi:MAG: hypothetical protein ACRC5T_05205, partial [Cetobacterium sp.]
REILVDYDTNHIYFKKSDGTFGSKTVELEELLNNFMGNGDDPSIGNSLPVQVEGLEAKNLGEALLELLNRIRLEKDRSPYKANVAVTTTGYLNNISGFPTIDGYTVKPEDRVLVRNQIISSENGIYVVDDEGVWNKPADFNDPADIRDGMTTMVMHGNYYGGHLFSMICTHIGGTIVYNINHITRNIMTGRGPIITDNMEREIKFAEPHSGVSDSLKVGTLIRYDKHGLVTESTYFKSLNIIKPTDVRTGFTDSQMIADDYTGVSVVAELIDGLEF